MTIFMHWGRICKHSLFSNLIPVLNIEVVRKVYYNYCYTSVVMKSNLLNCMWMKSYQNQFILLKLHGKDGWIFNIYKNSNSNLTDRNNDLSTTRCHNGSCILMQYHLIVCTSSPDSKISEMFPHDCLVCCFC